MSAVSLAFWGTLVVVNSMALSFNVTHSLFVETIFSTIGLFGSFCFLLIKAGQA